jgi:hypothetical protein
MKRTAIHTLREEIRMKHVRVIGLSALLVACSSIGVEGENVVPGNSQKGDKPSVDVDAGIGDENADESSDVAGGEQAADDDAVPESTIVGSEDELDALLAAGSADGQTLGGVTLRLVDAPVEAEAVNVTFCGVQVHMLTSGERPAGQPEPMMARDAGAAAAGSVQPPREMNSEPPPEGFAPPRGSAASAGMAPPTDVAPPEDEMRQPPDDAPDMAVEMRPPPMGSLMLPPEDMRPLDELPEDRDVMVADGGVVQDEHPRPIDFDGGMAPPPPERAPLADGGMPMPEGMRPSGIVTDTPPGHWLGVGETCVTVDLLGLQEGVFEDLGFAALPVGNYGQIRLHLTAAEVVVDGVTHPLTVPSGEESGLKIEGGFTVEDGEVTTLTVDFDAARSLEETERGDYVMKPVIFLAGAERRVVRPPQPMGQASTGQAGDVRDPNANMMLPDPGRDPAPGDMPPPRASGEATKPMDERPAVDGMPPADDTQPATSGREEGMVAPMQSQPPRDVPPPSSGMPDEQPPPMPSEGDMPPPPAGGAAPRASGMMPPPPPPAG